MHSDAQEAGLHISDGGATLDAATPSACTTGEDCARQGARASDQRDHVNARTLFERACELNHPLGCKWLSLDLDHERDPRAPADKERGQLMMEKACELGELDSCRMVANSYLYGNRPGVSEDHERAVKLLQTTCDAGDGASCEGLANCYADGTGVAKDKALARKLRKRAAELGYVGE